jgi:hypothetical protein
MSPRREDLIQAALAPDLVQELKDLNRPVRQTIEQLSLLVGARRASPSSG